MDLLNIPLFHIMKDKLDYSGQRQSLLAQNVANADTPDYKARDIQTPDFSRMMSTGQKLHMTMTSTAHMTGNLTSNGIFKTINRKTTDELNPNGNNVVIEEEMAKVGENQAEHQKVLNLYAKAISMFKTAIGGNGSGG